MKMAVIGGGTVAQTLGAALARDGHEVTIGVRDSSAAGLAKPQGQAGPLSAWREASGGQVRDIATAAGAAEMVWNAASGGGSLPALQAAGRSALSGKILVDVANPLDFSHGMPPFLIPEFAGPTSLAEQIQAAYPETRVVKAFNTMPAALMADPGRIEGTHDFLLAGNDAAAKETVADIARGWGWREILDLGDLTGARAMEAHLMLWVRLWMTTGSPIVNIHVLKG